MTQDDVRNGAEEGNRKGEMPPTEEIPEPPRHRLYITGEDGHTLRFVDSDHPDVWGGNAHRERDIVRCGICGHDSSDWGWGEMPEHHAWIAHEHHVERRHVGVKVVWRAVDVVDMSLRELSRRTRRRRLNGENPVTTYRGDTPVETLRELVDSEGEPVVVVHQPPPGEAFPGSIEEDATEAFYVA